MSESSDGVGHSRKSLVERVCDSVIIFCEIILAMFKSPHGYRPVRLISKTIMHSTKLGINLLACRCDVLIAQ